MELKKCPFCGGEAYLEKSSRVYNRGKTEKAAYVRCLDCSARTGKVMISDYGFTSHSKDAEEKAVEMWNRRV